MESENEDEDSDASDIQDEDRKGKEEDDLKQPFANEVGASKKLKGFSRQSSLNVDKDLVLTSSGLNIVKSLLPRSL